MKTGLMAILFAGTILLLSGCDDGNGDPTVVTIRPGGPCASDQLNGSYCTAGFGGSIPFGLPIGKGQHIVNAVNFSSMKLSMAGTTVGLPSSGTFIITVKDQNGLIITQNSFPWTQSGSNLIASNPQSIANWMATITQTIYSVDVETASMPVTTSIGPNVFTATLEYNNTPLAISASTWTSNCPSGPQADPLLCG